MAKTVALDWGPFFAGDIHPKERTAVMLIPALAAGTIAFLGRPEVIHASIVGIKIVHAFNPLIQALQAFSYPVSFLGMAAGMLLVSVGQRHRGLTMVKWAAIGYIGMQLVPGIMEMVAQVGDAMK